VQKIPLGTDVYDCLMTGTVSVSIDVIDPLVLAVGALDQPNTMVTQGTLTTTRLAGSVVYSTPAMFVGLGANYPYAGEFSVVGENSSIRLVADNDVDVRIDIDSNGDTVIDETIVNTRAELASM
jgi:hypothetical protein